MCSFVKLFYTMLVLCKRLLSGRLQRSLTRGGLQGLNNKRNVQLANPKSVRSAYKTFSLQSLTVLPGSVGNTRCMALHEVSVHSLTCITTSLNVFRFVCELLLPRLPG